MRIACQSSMSYTRSQNTIPVKSDPKPNAMLHIAGPEATHYSTFTAWHEATDVLPLALVATEPYD
jgi:hypothetical protein